jgi:hypothetical protein
VVADDILFAGNALDDMLGHEAVTAGVAGPQVADDIV